MGQDLIFDKSMRDALSAQDDYPGEVLFSPLNFRPQDLSNDLDAVRLNDEDLIHFGTMATQIKERFAQIAVDLSMADDIAEEEEK